MKHIKIFIVLSFAFSFACNRKGFDSKGIARAPETKPIESVGNNQAVAPVDNRSSEEILCQEGPLVIGPVSEVDFSAQFAIVCNETTTNEFFKELVRDAYQGGEGTPEVKKVQYTVDENYITNLVFAYAIKVPIEKPTLITDLEVHNIFAEGIRDESSELVVNVLSREPFPSRRSIEKVVLEYDLKTAQRAGINDVRRTAFNTYLLKEKYEDVSVSTENLVDNSSEFYHTSNSLTIGLKAENNQTYIIVVNDFVIKNRIDPD
ncbi:MAG: hypothetical protein ACOH5I_03145 [Oligoflexus sp.]